MSAARGVIHSELPLIHEGLLHGFQLWINLPAKQKLQAPQYKQATREELPSVTLANGTQLRAFGGTWTVEGHTLKSPLNNFAASARTLDITLPANTSLTLAVNEPDTVLAYVFEGSISTDNQVVKKQQMARYSSGAQVVLQAGNESTRLLLLSGTPLGEPIAQYGPFVMNTEQEIQQTIEAYRSGTLVKN